MHSILACLQHEHDPWLIALAGLICTIGVFASFAMAAHAGRTRGAHRRRWGLVAIVCTGCTAWTTHFVALLAFRPGVPAAFDPILTAASLLIPIVLIGAIMSLTMRRATAKVRFGAGVGIGLAVAVLHYLGQSAYLVRGHVHWDLGLVLATLLASLPIFGFALVAVAERRRGRRRAAAPLLLLAIAVLHFGGMAAMAIVADPAVRLPASAVSPAAITPVVAIVCIGIVTLAVLGMRFDLAAKAQARRDRERLRALANVSLEGLLICDGDTIVSANTSVARLSGYSLDALTGRFASSLLPGVDLPSLPDREEREAALVRSDGETVPVRVLRSQVPVGHRMQTVVAVRDQRERLRTEAQIRTLAFSDQLTGLPNRARFNDLAAVHAAWHREQGRSYALVLVDLQRFKDINDRHGHAIGDQLLRKVADRLTSTIGGGDLIARLGGDVFAVLQLDIRHPDWPEELAKTLAEALNRKPFVVDGEPIDLAASVGVAVSSEADPDPQEMLRCAELALGAAKAGAGVDYRIYVPALDALARTARELMAGLRSALANDEFVLHYQPLIDADSGRIMAAEALLRWQHPSRGLIAPGEFIPLTEQSGLIVPIGAWVLATACSEAALWPGGMGVAVNLSPVQFKDPALADTVRAALAQSGLAPNRLELEITEGVLLEQDDQTTATMEAIRGLGVRISMDDFGTGYSSLGNLRRLSISRIKIDRSFVENLPGDPDSAAIVRAIIAMGTGLGLATTMEGVETLEQLAFASREGCSVAQGFFVSPPLAPAEFRQFIGQASNHLADLPRRVAAIDARRHAIAG